MIELKNRFKDNLKMLREEKGLGQEALANEIGVSKGIISLWENGQREPNMRNIMQVAIFFQVHSDFLLGLSEY